MNQSKVIENNFKNMRKNLFANFIINWAIPVVMVIVLRSIYSNDAIALAIAGIIPVVRTLFVYLVKEKVEWIGVISALGFVVGGVISVFYGGSSLPLKLYHPALTGIIGVIFIGSVVIKKPMIIIILKLLKRENVEINNKEYNNRVTKITTLIGSVLIIDSIVHIIMALTLPTVTYLTMSRIVTIIFVLVLLASRKLIVFKIK